MLNVSVLGAIVVLSNVHHLNCYLAVTDQEVEGAVNITLSEKLMQ